jgi:D-glycero-D-manno-heptose 1,7-bisphosphate phosphatase
MPQRTIFLDRDGVINKEISYLHKIDDFVFINGVFKSCLYLKKLGYEIIIITNQSGIARGYYSELDYQILTSWMLNHFKKNNIEILDIFHCPHSPEASCKCRKPRPGMLLKAKRKYSIDMANSWLIGDKEIDIQAAENAGIRNTIIVKSGHKINESTSKADYFLESIKDCHKVIFN